ncbi:cation:proton antiporter [Salinibacterium sp. G-O1]|uniref:cation:proton antiporter n=1 Tax=Salinibacterium sp. G-O1 TaxID=3046208 RepID=UPI0024BB6A7F|nr:cation:proton antiporter [Salinibacterium sp. G-O1]MDJ0334211.1 cation:proton antiporter [Salinibacterium sp. G-O1]
MHLGEDLLVLGLLFVIAYGFGRLGKLIGLPAIPIYMLVGVLASPNTHFFPLDFEAADVELVAVFGLILLLFSLGLEFDQDEFYGNARALILSGGTRIAINLVVGFALGLWIGWGTREALIVAGMTATSSSAIVTKLLIELRRLANRETPTILGILVLEDVFVASYLAIVGVVLGGQTDGGAIALQLAISFSFLIAMFALARWGGRFVSRLVNTKDDELFTILFFGLAVAFGGIGEMLGVSDAIGAFLIGLVLGATKFRARIEALALPLRNVFAAFFFLNFGLALDVSTFGEVLIPAGVAVVMTLIVNTLGGQLIAWQNGLTRAEGLNVSAMLQTRGEFALILATLATAAGLDPRLTPFAGLYVLSMAIIGPVLAVNSEKMGKILFKSKPSKKRQPSRDRMQAEEIALVEAAMAGEDLPEPRIADDIIEVFPDSTGTGHRVADQPHAERSDEQPEEHFERKRDPEY